MQRHSTRQPESARREHSDQETRHSLPSVFVRGLAMGSADVVPGVSGGTIALILGFYQRLINSVRAIPRPEFLGNLFRGRFREAAEAADLPFLITLVAGIVTAILSLARVFEAALDARPAFVFAFFFGLVLASVFVVFRRIRRPLAAHWLLLAAAAVAMYLFMGVAPAQTPEDAWFLFLAGAIAISALLLPGVSGAFVLVMLGKYDYVLQALNRFDFSVLIPVIAGMVVGVLSFAQLLGWLFRRFHDTTLAVLCGIMLGSLRRVWPWQVEEGGVLVNVPPPAQFWSTVDGLGWALLLTLAGISLVLGLNYLESRTGGEESAERA